MVYPILGSAMEEAAARTILFLPKLVATLIVLVVGLYIGKLLGRIVAQVIEKVGLDELLKRTALGEYIERSGVAIVGLFDLAVRWFIYLVVIMAAVNILQIDFLTSFLKEALLYIPNLVAGLLILVVGLIFVDFVVDFLRKSTKELEVEYINAVAFVLRVFLYFIIVVTALDQLKIKTTIIYTIITPISYGIAIGAGIAIGIALGLGLKDVVAKYAEARLLKK